VTAAGDFPRTPDRKMLAEMVSDAAIAARGVAAVCDAGATLGRRGPLGEQRVRLRVGVVAAYGVRLPEMAAEVRALVAIAVENRTGGLVTAVDVTVADLYVPGEPSLALGPSADPAAGARIDF
jgi:uncharacterized alkaline shock family protein YloU